MDCSAAFELVQRLLQQFKGDEAGDNAHYLASCGGICLALRAKLPRQFQLVHGMLQAIACLTEIKQQKTRQAKRFRESLGDPLASLSASSRSTDTGLLHDVLHACCGSQCGLYRHVRAP